MALHVAFRLNSRDSTSFNPAFSTRIAIVAEKEIEERPGAPLSHGAIPARLEKDHTRCDTIVRLQLLSVVRSSSTNGSHDSRAGSGGEACATPDRAGGQWSAIVSRVRWFDGPHTFCSTRRSDRFAATPVRAFCSDRQCWFMRGSIFSRQREASHSSMLGFFSPPCFSTALHSFWGNYLPRVYPTRLRGTGESFAANIGGRVIGVSAVFITTTLSNVMPGSSPAARLAYSAGFVSLFGLFAALVGSLSLQEPDGVQLPD